jgi:undecaprenyl diphosphate synthase
MIRTGGEKRISNFILWQAAYAELWFSDVYWPQFGPEHLHEALEWYDGRERRFGKTSEQIQAGEGENA